jgi:ribosomal protein S18 acetylase RimI-like enzyme
MWKKRKLEGTRVKMLRIVEVRKKDRQSIIQRLRSNLLHNLFVIYDLLYKPEKTTIYAAYNSSDSLKGHLLIYKGFATLPLAARLDGEGKHTQKLLELLSNEKLVLFCPPNLLNIVKKKFPEACCYPEYQMYVAKGEERLVIPNLAEMLKPEHAPLLSELYSSGEPAFIRSEERCRDLLEKSGVYGAFERGKLVSAAISVKRLPEVGEVTSVLTRPKNRGRGFGTMVTSAATEDVLRHADGSNLYVRADNKPAIKVYEKLGYKKIDEWYWIDIGTGSKP